MFISFQSFSNADSVLAVLLLGLAAIYNRKLIKSEVSNGNNTALCSIMNNSVSPS